MEAGATPNLPDRHGNNAIHLAVVKRTTDCLRDLVTSSAYSTESVDVNALNYEGMVKREPFLSCLSCIKILILLRIFMAYFYYLYNYL